jgi:hypothetical protein
MERCKVCRHKSKAVKASLRHVCRNCRSLLGLSDTYLISLAVKGCTIVKIGHAKDVYDRMRELQAGCPFRLFVFGIVPDGGEVLERQLHQQFKAHRMCGEWFHLSLEQVLGIPGLDMNVPSND